MGNTTGPESSSGKQLIAAISTKSTKRVETIMETARKEFLSVKNNLKMTGSESYKKMVCILESSTLHDAPIRFA